MYHHRCLLVNIVQRSERGILDKLRLLNDNEPVDKLIAWLDSPDDRLQNHTTRLSRRFFWNSKEWRQFQCTNVSLEAGLDEEYATAPGRGATTAHNEEGVEF